LSKKIELNKLVFASNNQHKVFEVQNIVGNFFKILSLQETGFSGDIPETQNTLEENAKQKADFIYNKLHVNCFADDTGLEVEALNGAPGVYSARYAGNDCNSTNNINKLLFELNGKNNRKAQFRTIIALNYNNIQYIFEGCIKGNILTEPKGNGGFGYDAVFLPNNSNKTFAEMVNEEKNKISHRAIAIKKLSEFLKNF